MKTLDKDLELFVDADSNVYIEVNIVDCDTYREFKIMFLKLNKMKLRAY